MDKKNLLYTNTLKPKQGNDPYMMAASITINQKKEIKLKKHIVEEKREEFLHKERTLDDFAFLPKSDFGLLMFFIFIPYILGSIFVLFYVFSGNIERFVDIFNDYSGLLIWGIGYEVIASLIILIFLRIVFFSFKATGKDIENKQVKRRRIGGGLR
ncbi:hypothetical protein MNB_SV-13-941 [hydrothermal vent metagenome]|uniref:Uncharacterized protein n=1 Tax=hydrothermal vent metagenome TaxID=652676 RepID=A0A1W1D0N0_9ZZZZ